MLHRYIQRPMHITQQQHAPCSLRMLLAAYGTDECFHGLSWAKYSQQINLEFYILSNKSVQRWCETQLAGFSCVI